MRSLICAALMALALGLGSPTSVGAQNPAPQPAPKEPYIYNNHLHDRRYGYFGPLEPGPFYGGFRYERYANQRGGMFPYPSRPLREGSSLVGPRRYGWR